MEKRHTCTKEKEESLYRGEWTDEFDEAVFKHKNLDCLVKRILLMETNGDWFGGYFCGYVFLPKNHGLLESCSYGRLDGCDVHGGTTFNDYIDERLALGFDCAHFCDFIPSNRRNFPYSIQGLPKQHAFHLKTARLRRRVPSRSASYKPIDFAILQCRKLADFVADPNVDLKEKK